MSPGMKRVALAAADEREALLAVVRAARPFARFLDGNAARSLPDNLPLTNGSSMARQQLCVRQFRDLREALANLDRLNP